LNNEQQIYVGMNENFQALTCQPVGNDAFANESSFDIMVYQPDIIGHIFCKGKNEKSWLNYC